jgi:two-component system, OmpR family, response regulator MprA
MSRLTMPQDPTADVPQPSTILVVDDEPDMLDLIAELVLASAPNCHVEKASNGPQAIERIKERPPALLLSDFLMPGMDGLALAKSVRASNHTFPIILMTAFVDSGLSKQVQSSGLVQAFFRKPVDPELLILEIQRLLGGAR